MAEHNLTPEQIKQLVDDAIVQMAATSQNLAEMTKDPRAVQIANAIKPHVDINALLRTVSATAKTGSPMQEARELAMNQAKESQELWTQLNTQNVANALARNQQMQELTRTAYAELQRRMQVYERSTAAAVNGQAGSIDPSSVN